jgi:hypothetical protein
MTFMVLSIGTVAGEYSLIILSNLRLDASERPKHLIRTGIPWLNWLIDWLSSGLSISRVVVISLPVYLSVAGGVIGVDWNRFEWWGEYPRRRQIRR